MKKIFILLLIAALAVVIASSVHAEPQTVVLTPSNWQDVNQKLDPARFGAAGTYPLSLYTGIGVVGSSQCSIALILANGTVTASSAAGSNVTLSQGIYLFAGYNDGITWYAYIYNINGWLATLLVPTSSGNIAFNKKVYGKIIYSGTPSQVIDAVTKILFDWRGASGGGLTAWLLFNVTGNQPVSYTIREGTYSVTMAYGGGSPIYMLYVGRTLPLNVTGSGLNQLFYAGAYLIVGSNWYRANYSATAPSQPNNQTGTATLTVTVTPSSYRIQFLSAGALVKEANATLSYAFPKNATVTVRILDAGGTEKYKFDVKMDSDKYYSFNFGADKSIYDGTKTYTLALYFFEMSPSGAYRGPIVVDSVQVVGINASLTRSAQGVSNVRFTNLPSGHYQIIVQKEGYFETRAWLNLDSDKTLYIGLFKKADVGATDKPYTGGYVAPTNTTQPFNTVASARNETPPAPTVSGNFYGFHFIMIDPASGARASGTISISAVKRVGKVLWEDTVTVPLATVAVNGSAWWYIAEDDVYRALQLAGFWEGFAGFKIASGSNTMFVPAELAKNRFYELVIYHGLAVFGSSNVSYSSGLFDSSGMLAQLMPLLVIAMIIGMIGQVLKRK